MASNKIGFVLALDGEKEFTAQIKAANKEANALKSELKGLSEEYKGNANSMEALQKKQDALVDLQTRYKQAVDAAKTVQEQAKKMAEEQADKLQALQKELDAAVKAQQKMADTGDTTSDTYRQQADKVEELSQAVREQATVEAQARGKLADWNKTLSQNENRLKATSKELDENGKYLDEAKQSADGTAKSIDKFGNVLNEAGKEADEFGDDVKDASKDTGSFGDSLKGAATVAAGNLLSAGLSKAADIAKDAAKQMVKVGSEFEHSMSQVKAISGASGGDLDAMAAKAKELGSATKFSAAEVADGFKYMSLAGWDAETMLSSIDGVVQLAAASEMELGEASDMVTDYLSAFGLEASYAGKMADEMAYAQANSNTSVEQLGEAFGNSASQAHVMGQSMETTTALLEAMANQGLKGSEAGTALNGVMQQIVQHMEDGKIAIGDTAVAVTDADGNFRDLIDIMADVEKATADMTEEQEASALQAVFNRTSLKGVNDILNEGVDNIRGYKEELEHADGAAADMAETMQDNLKGSMDKFKSAAEGLGIAVYDNIKEPLTDVVDFGTKVLSGLTDVFDGADTSASQQWADGIKSAAEEAADAVETMKSKIAAAQESYDSETAAAAKVKILGDQLVELMNTEDRTAAQTATMHSIIKELGGYIPEITEKYNEQTGVLNLTTQAVKDLTDAQSDQMIEAAKAKLGSEALDAMVEASTKLNAAMQETQEAAAKRDVWQEFGTELGNLMQAQNEFATGYEGVKTVSEAVHDAAAVIGTAFRDNRMSIQDYADALNLLPNSTDVLAQSVKDLYLTQEEADAVQKLLTGDYVDATYSIEAVGRIIESIDDAQRTSAKSMEEYGKTIKDTRPALEEAELGYDGLLKSLGLVEDASGNVVSAQEAVARATGIALPEVDQLSETYYKDRDAALEAGNAWDDGCKKMEDAGEAASDLNDGLKDSTDATEELAEEEDKLADKEKWVADAQKKRVDAQREAQKATDEYRQSVKELDKDLEQIWKEGIPGVGEYLESVHGQISEAINSRDADTVAALQGTIDKSVEQIRAGAESSGQAIEDAYSSIYEDLKGEFEAIINPFEEWQEPDVPDISVEKMLDNLTKQQEYLEQYEENLSIVRDHVGQEITPQLMAKIEEMGPEGAKALEHVVATLEQDNADQLLHELSDKWTEGLDYSDGISRSMSANILAYRTALGKIGSSGEEWNTLRANINTRFEGVDNDMKADLMTLVNTAQTCGIKIPDGFTEGVLAGDYDLTTATATMNGALESSFAELLQAAQDAGVEVPDSVKEGIESADTSVIANAFTSLLALLADSEVKKEGKSKGTDFADSYSDGVKSKQAVIQQTATEVAGASAAAMSGQKIRFKAAGAESGASFSSGVLSKTGTVSSSGSKLAESGASGAKGKDGAYVAAGSSAGGAYATGVNSGRGQAQSAGAGLSNAAVSGAKNADKSGFTTTGRQMADGLKAGIESKIAEVANTAAQMIRAALNAAKAEAKTHSPSRAFRDEVGYQIAAGTAWGIEQGTPLAEAAASDLALKTLKAAKSWLDEYKSERYVSLSEEQWYWEEVAKHVGKGTEAYRLLQEQMNRAIQYMPGTKRWATLAGVGTSSMFSADYVARMTGMSVADFYRQLKRNFGLEQEYNGDGTWESWEDYQSRVYERAKNYVSDLAELTDISVKDMVDMRVALTALAHGTDSYIDSVKALLSAQQASVKAEQEAAEAEIERAIERQERANTLYEEYLDKRDEITRDYYDKAKERAQDYYEAVEDRQRDILQDFRLFEGWDSEGQTGDVLMKNLQQQVAGLAFYAEHLEALENRGILSQGLIDSLRAMGADEAANIYSLGQMTDEELKQYQALYDERERLAKMESARESQALLDESINAIEAAGKAEREELAKVFSAYAAEMRDLIPELMAIPGFSDVFRVSGDGRLSTSLYTPETYDALRTMQELQRLYGYVDNYDNSLSEIISRYSGAWGTDGMSSAALNEQVQGLNLNALQALNSALGAYYDGGQHITVDNSSQAMSMAQMADAVTKLVALVSSMTVQLDTGVVAGALAPAISESLAAESLSANGGLI